MKLPDIPPDVLLEDVLTVRLVTSCLFQSTSKTVADILPDVQFHEHVKFRGRADGVEGDVGKRASVRVQSDGLIYYANDSTSNKQHQTMSAQGAGECELEN